jgi:hypothetical protein
MRSIEQLRLSGLSEEAKAKSRLLILHSYHSVLVVSGVTMSASRETNLACPFFVPLEMVNDGSWPHPSRLPLGAGWNGNCCASGRDQTPSETQVREFCNLGYATGCPHLPTERDCDAIRFSVVKISPGQVAICFVSELAHAPIEQGTLVFDLTNEVWLNVHRDPRVLRLATSFLQSYRTRQKAAAA